MQFNSWSVLGQYHRPSNRSVPCPLCIFIFSCFSPTQTQKAAWCTNASNCSFFQSVGGKSRHRDQTCRAKPWTSNFKADHMLTGSPEAESSPSQTNLLSDHSQQGAVPGSESRIYSHAQQWVGKINAKNRF